MAVETRTSPLVPPDVADGYFERKLPIIAKFSDERKRDFLHRGVVVLPVIGLSFPQMAGLSNHRGFSISYPDLQGISDHDRFKAGLIKKEELVFAASLSEGFEVALDPNNMDITKKVIDSMYIDPHILARNHNTNPITGIDILQPFREQARKETEASKKDSRGDVECFVPSARHLTELVLRIQGNRNLSEKFRRRFRSFVPYGERAFVSGDDIFDPNFTTIYFFDGRAEVRICHKLTDSEVFLRLLRPKKIEEK